MPQGWAPLRRALFASAGGDHEKGFFGAAAARVLAHAAYAAATDRNSFDAGVRNNYEEPVLSTRPRPASAAGMMDEIDCAIDGIQIKHAPAVAGEEDVDRAIMAAVKELEALRSIRDRALACPAQAAPVLEALRSIHNPGSNSAMQAAPKPPPRRT